MSVLFKCFGYLSFVYRIPEIWEFFIFCSICRDWLLSETVSCLDLYLETVRESRHDSLCISLTYRVRCHVCGKGIVRLLDEHSPCQYRLLCRWVKSLGSLSACPEYLDQLKIIAHILHHLVPKYCFLWIYTVSWFHRSLLWHCRKTSSKYQIEFSDLHRLMQIFFDIVLYCLNDNDFRYCSFTKGSRSINSILFICDFVIFLNFFCFLFLV